MVNAIYIALIMLALLATFYMESDDLKITQEHSKRTYCELYGCYETNNN